MIRKLAICLLFVLPILAAIAGLESAAQTQREFDGIRRTHVVVPALDGHLKKGFGCSLAVRSGTGMDYEAQRCRNM